MTEPVPHEHTHGIPGGNPFTNKIGPLPVAVWAVIIVAVGGGAYLLIKRRSSNSVSTNATAATDNTGSGVNTDGTTDAASGAWSANSPANSGGTVSTVNGTPASATNAQWAANVANALIAAGADPTVVQNALSDYLNGKTLTAQEQAIINQAVQRYGVPPEGVLPVHGPVPASSGGTTPADSSPPPVGKPHAPPPTHVPPKPAPAPAPHPSSRTYIVQPGDNLTAIARKFYGNDNWQKIYNANKGVIGGNPDLIKPGQHLVIP